MILIQYTCNCIVPVSHSELNLVNAFNGVAEFKIKISHHFTGTKFYDFFNNFIKINFGQDILLFQLQNGGHIKTIGCGILSLDRASWDSALSTKPKIFIHDWNYIFRRQIC